MATFIIAALIAVATFFGIRRLFKSKGLAEIVSVRALSKKKCTNPLI